MCACSAAQLVLKMCGAQVAIFVEHEERSFSQGTHGTFTLQQKQRCYLAGIKLIYFVSTEEMRLVD
jgi:hypothetical protein